MGIMTLVCENCWTQGHVWKFSSKTAVQSNCPRPLTPFFMGDYLVSRIAVHFNIIELSS